MTEPDRRIATGADLAGWSCPVPLRHHERIVLGHGGGGRLSQELVEHLFLPAFGVAAASSPLTDAATIHVGDGARLAFTTDSYVVRPLFFPGGNIGDLAVCGTVNDLATSGARPLALSLGFVLEEGLELEVLGRIADSIGRSARRVGASIATGDTKVVERGHGDGVYVNTAGIGLIPAGVDLSPVNVRPGDAVVVSGPVGLHGVAVLSVREGLEFGTEIRSDVAPLDELVAAMLAASTEIHALRDLTRGGLTAALCELAESAAVGIEIDERAVPVPEPVRSACGFLGLDPFHVANEGKMVAFVPGPALDGVVAAMHDDPAGADAAVIGRVVAEHPGVVTARTVLGARRVLDMPLGEQLPRIC